MSIGTIIYSILIEPLQIIFEYIYGIADLLINSKGFSVIMLSIAMNFLVLPLYKKADLMQAAERDMELKLQDGVKHIKKYFKGDMRMMMLQTYYRQNNYKPVYALRGTAPLLLQIPFFIAAYRFLSTYQGFNGTGFGLIKDMSQPDGLLTLFGVGINILPVLMTVINLASAAIYSKDYPAKTKVQLVAVALFFLVFLYNSPSGLVFYWTLNNAFSMVKTVVMKTKNPKKTTAVLFSAAGLVSFLLNIVYSLNYSTSEDNDVEISIALLMLIVCIVPFTVMLIKSRFSKASEPKKETELKPDFRQFILCGVLLALLCGALIPSAVINSSPQEFVFTSYYRNPLWFVVSSLCISVGMFVIWFSVFYLFSSDKGKVLFGKASRVLCAVALIDYFFFGKNYGILKNNLSYGSQVIIYTDYTELLVNFLVLAVIIAVVLLFEKWKKSIIGISAVLIIAICILTVYNAVGISSSVSKIDLSRNTNETSYRINLSKTEKNVVVLMIDRAMGLYLPFIVNEKPELKEQFDGFTYYNNTISHGRNTNFGTPGLFGGYEYTPVEMNTRDGEKLVEKHNEALKIMPKVFSSNGYDVTVYNPPYANYQELSDLSIYDDLENVKAYNMNEALVDSETLKTTIKNNDRNFFLYSIMKISPVCFHKMIYNNGFYHGSSVLQKIIDGHHASGHGLLFISSYNFLSNMPKVTVTEGIDKGNVTIIANKLTHENQLMQEPEYEITDVVDNEEYDKEHENRFEVEGLKINVNSESYTELSLYQVNVSSLVLIGRWLDYLKTQDVYDNTKIIIVSDHGASLRQYEDFVFEDSGIGDAESFYPLLLVKDFNDRGKLKTSEEFMTNADVPTMAFKDTVENPVNPFTGKAIDNSEKYAHNQYIIASVDYIVSKNNGNAFLPARWYSVHDSIWDRSNWQKVAEGAVLKKSDVEKIEKGK